MTYYQVKTESDNEYLHGKKDILVGKELKTAREIEKLKLTAEYVKRHFNALEVSRKGTHYFFGARFISIGFTPKYI